MSSSSSGWSREQEKAFENALAAYPEDCGRCWERIAAAVKAKSVGEVKRHYEVLVEDVDNIEAGRVPLPQYGSEDDVGSSRRGGRSDQERRKGIAWTEEEHRLFLLGLEKYGKGDWRSISRNYVISRTPTQVASHAQKYFNRLMSTNKDRRRTSIHDITSVGDGDASTPEGPITGQTNGLPVTPGRSGKQPSHLPTAMPAVGVYGTTIGQPVGTPLGSAVGTPVNLPMPVSPHMAYGVRMPVVGTVVPGAPMHIMKYPMPHAPTRR